MSFRRTFGWLLVLGALAIGAAELRAWSGDGGTHIIAAGELWFKVSPNSLNLVQAVVQRHLHPALWDDVMRPLLLLPAWAVLAALGVLLAVPGVLLLLSGRRRRRRYSSRHS